MKDFFNLSNIFFNNLFLNKFFLKTKFGKSIEFFSPTIVSSFYLNIHLFLVLLTNSQLTRKARETYLLYSYRVEKNKNHC